ncbi:MAG: ATP-dependent Clp protease adaptor protein ClpS [uncultured Sulfurovum sp.]|uniref:ATP-dependent Clp protease adapter protein ClpS n=1 Tax=uncultured Sulfurovum sp. TaxID=269237 RepID=A0A6S6T981_9BACT|nr:MAG: ATP-dependent Clp protease adaptor protein ClpS [uncultured Sulfurovum sp.]
MPVTVKPRVNIKIMQINEPKIYFVSIIYDKYISWEFCMRVLTDVFHMSTDNAQMITDEILTNGEGLCGGYMYEIAQSKAVIVEELAEKEGFSLQCIIEEV